MKPRLILSFTFLIIFGFMSFSQEETTSLLNYDFVKKSIEKSDLAIQDPAKNIKSNTWINRAKAYENAYKVNIQQLYVGMSPLQVQFFYKNPEKQTLADGRQVEIYDGRTKVIYKDGIVESFEDIAKLNENPLAVELEAYKKAIELDTKGKVGSHITKNLSVLKDEFFYQASLSFTKDKDYKSAFEYFQHAIETMEMDAYTGVLDTNLYYNTGLAANLAEDYEDAAKYYKKAIDVGYDEPEIYNYTRDIYLTLKDTAAALDVLKLGFQNHPDNKDIVLNMINLFISSKKTQEALDFINLAKKTNQSSELYFAEGALLEEIKKPEDAKKSYLKSLEINSDNVNANYNLGVLYFNDGVQIYNKAADIKDDTEYSKQKDLAFIEYKRGLEYLEKALKAEPNQKIIMQTLRTVYYRLGDDAKMKEMEDRIKYAD